MEEKEIGRQSLIASIEKDANSEADTIIAEARKLVDEQKAYGEKQAEKILKTAEMQAADQSENVKKKALAGLDIEVRRRMMHAQDSVLNIILEKVENQMQLLVKTKKYRGILQNWVVEAAVGLNANSAVITTSEKELALIDKTFLTDAEKKVTSYTGRNQTLSLSKKKLNRTQGVILTAKDGRTAYDNQVRTRIARREREIRKQIYDALFANDKEI